MRRPAFATLLSLAVLAAAPAAEPPAAGGAAPDLLVDTKWLDENSIRPEIVVVDVRPEWVFARGHIPNARQLDDSRLVARDGPPPYLLKPDAFKAMMEALGVGDDAHVVAVDASGGPGATRLWWALGYYGHDKVSVLDGGFDRWAAEGRAVTTDAPLIVKAAFTPKPRPQRAASLEDVQVWAARKKGLVVDARSPQEFSGELARGKRGGHIPGAVNVPYSENLVSKGKFSVFKSPAELAELYTKAGVGKQTPVAAYCFEGRRATHALFSLALAGLTPEGALYVGSWKEWSSRDDLPAEKGGGAFKKTEGPTRPAPRKYPFKPAPAKAPPAKAPPAKAPAPESPPS